MDSYSIPSIDTPTISATINAVKSKAAAPKAKALNIGTPPKIVFKPNAPAPTEIKATEAPATAKPKNPPTIIPPIVDQNKSVPVFPSFIALSYASFPPTTPPAIKPRPK